MLLEKLASILGQANHIQQDLKSLAKILESCRLIWGPQWGMGVLRVRSPPWISEFVSDLSYSIFFPFQSLSHLSDQRLLVFHHCFNHRSAPALFFSNNCVFAQIWLISTNFSCFTFERFGPSPISTNYV